MRKLTKSERRENSKKRRARHYKIHSRSLGEIYYEENKKRANRKP